MVAGSTSWYAVLLALTVRARALAEKNGKCINYTLRSEEKGGEWVPTPRACRMTHYLGLCFLFCFNLFFFSSIHFFILLHFLMRNPERKRERERENRNEEEPWKRLIWLSK